jgi:hypothetical protein
MPLPGAVSVESGCGLPADVTPCGQLPGAVSTTPTTMLGSTAFIAEMYAFTFCA